jgi:hypothetical protein
VRQFKKELVAMLLLFFGVAMSHNAMAGFDRVCQPRHPDHPRIEKLSAYKCLTSSHAAPRIEIENHWLQFNRIIRTRLWAKISPSPDQWNSSTKWLVKYSSSAKLPRPPAETIASRHFILGNSRPIRAPAPASENFVR